MEAKIETPEWRVAVSRMTPEEPVFDYDVSFTAHGFRPDPYNYFGIYFFKFVNTTVRIKPTKIIF